METQNIDQLIGKYFLGEALPEEAMALEDWKQASAENKAYFDACEKLYGPGNGTINSKVAWQKMQPKLGENGRIRTLFTPLRMAAAVLAIVGLSSLLYFLIPDIEPQNTLYTAKSVREVKLDDGSSVRMAQGTSIEKVAGYGQLYRRVKLKGSAYFTIQHQADKPFIIETEKIYIKDLGTKFDVKETGDTIYIRVDEGKVQIYNHKGVNVTVEASQSAYYVISLNEVHIEVSKAKQQQIPVKLIFEDEKLNDVVKTINALYHRNITIENQQLNECRVTTSFMNEDLEFVLDIITETLGIYYIQRNGEYVLIGKSCHS